MNSKQTDSNQEKKQSSNGWTPTSEIGKRKGVKPTSEEMDAQLQEMFESSYINDDSPSPKAAKKAENSVGIDEHVETGDGIDTSDSLQIESTDSTRYTVPKRISSKQRKESLEEYRDIFLRIPKLEDRKPVFISREVRDGLDEIARKLGGRRMSVSGFIENLARHHLETYLDDVELWKKL